MKKSAAISLACFAASVVWFSVAVEYAQSAVWTRGCGMIWFGVIAMVATAFLFILSVDGEV